MSILDTLPKSKTPGVLLDAETVHEMLPQKEPFAFVDEVNELFEEDGKFAIRATKYVLGTEGYFRGHFPGEPIMPGVLQVEALAQAGCMLAALNFAEEIKGRRPAFMGVDKCKFLKPVRPGDVLKMKVVLERYRKGFMEFSGEMHSGDSLVCSAVLKAMMV